MLLKKLFWWLPFGTVPEISSPDLDLLIEKDQAPFILDVRTEPEFNEGHIQGAVNLPLGSLKGEINHLNIDPDRPVVAICRSAHRSIPAVRLLSLAGFNNARQLQGGMIAWLSEGYPVQVN